MAPAKFDPADPAVASLITSFASLGLPPAKATEAARSAKNAAALKDLIVKNGLEGQNLGEKRASLIASWSIASAKLDEEKRSYGVKAIVDERTKTQEQINAASKFLETNPIDDKRFDSACGVGVELSPEETYSIFKSLVSMQSVEGWNALNGFIAAAKAGTRLRWAPALDVKNAAERVFTELFGPKEAAKVKAKEAKKPAATPKASTSTATPASTTPTINTSVFEEGFLGHLHRPGENPQISPKLRDAHLAATGGKVFTRFPPEPNGFLHIGHSKAIFVNFGYAAHHKGHTYLRYDDTNPEAEEGRYFESILETVRWLGFEPWKITYSSDYFQELYEMAVELIKRDKAYICHCTGEEIKADRGGDNHSGPRRPCKHRSRPIEESLAEFQAMKDGKYRPGKAILRMKQDLEDGNPQMWDLIAYRVLDAPHHRTGTKWKIYPTYDFTHCLVDSLENISHSLCTTEFIQSRQSYDWLCDALEVYKPRQSEYGRLNIQGTVMSKRKIQKLVKENYVLDWDDPRLYTLVALRRRGVPPAAILSFVSHLGVSTALSNIQIVRFEGAIRAYLESTAPRLSIILHPLKVTITNVPGDYLVMVEKQLHPKVPELGKVTIPFTRTLYIDADDFRIEDSPDYFRLAPGKTVGLFGAPFPVTCVSYKTDPSTGAPIELEVRLENDTSAKPIKPKAFIQWVAEHAPSGSPVIIDETRVFHSLFKSDNPAALENFLDDINPGSMEVIKGGMAEIGFWKLAKRAILEARKESKSRTDKALKEEEAVASAKEHGGDTPMPTAEQLVGNECVRFQGLRVAYFTVDKDSKMASVDEPESTEPGRRNGDKLILNRIVSLKEDVGKKA